MSCKANNWSFRFINSKKRLGELDVQDSKEENVELEIRPIEMTFKRNRGKYDFARLKVSSDVGDILKEETGEGGSFNRLTVVKVKYDGEHVHSLLFRPDWTTFGYNFTHIKLKDLQKSLKSGNVDIQKKDTKLKPIYKKVINSANNKKINGYDFAFPENQVREIISPTRYVKIGSRSGTAERVRRVNENVDVAFSESSWAIDFDDITPEKALHKLNKKFNITSWINSNGKLIIGIPEARENSITHIAASNDSRVWRYKDPNVSYSKNPIKKTMVIGNWEDASGIENPLEWFSEGGTADARVVGIAERNDVSNGDEIIVDVDGAKKNAVEYAARLQLIEKTKKQNSGTIEIDTNLSGTKVSDPIDVLPGDIIQLVPNDKYFKNPGKDSGSLGDTIDYPDKVCGGVVKNENYIIKSVEDKITNDGDWKIKLNLHLYPQISDDDIDTGIKYYNPNKEEYYSENEFDSGFVFENV